MNAEQFRYEMELIAEEYNDDIEAKHHYMDNLMCKLLSEIGYEDGINIFRDTDKWYA